MNNLLVTYETNLVQSYGDDANRSKTVLIGTTLMPNTMQNTDDQYLVFGASGNNELRTELSDLPHKMQNPFTDMRRWLKFEILDLNAILEAIDKKNETEKRRNKQIEDRREAIK